MEKDEIVRMKKMELSVDEKGNVGKVDSCPILFCNDFPCWRRKMRKV